MKTIPVKAFEVVGEQHSPEARKPGAFVFMLNQSQERMGIIHACPCGCSMQGAMWFRGKADAGGAEWDVSGEWPNVTMSPSIGFAKDSATNQYHWHGYLERGWFVNERAEAPQ